MKYIKSAFALIIALLFPLIVFAEETAPAEPLGKIQWAIEKSGPMPKSLTTGLILLAVIIIITVLVIIMKEADEK